MSKKYKGSCNKWTEWGEVGLPKEGILSSRQLAQLIEKLEKKEKESAEHHKSLSKQNKTKNEVFQADWKVFCMWKDECHVRESKMFRRQNTNEHERPKQIEPEHIVYRPKDCSGTEPLYPVLSEFHKVDPDLDSAPPLPPPPYQSQASQQGVIQASPPPSENEAATQRAHRGDASEASLLEPSPGSVKSHSMHTRSKGQNFPPNLEEQKRDDMHVLKYTVVMFHQKMNWEGTP
ncbi:hypothetical protein [Paraclostridium dentum]|uniref:hypothetical protein n=1 Tax=Paraclostridium dentum TaxID=2662455 RepID=UPI003F39F738